MMVRDAVISPDGVYRYTLRRTWDAEPPALLWIMLNPSTADGNVDDATVKKVIGFSWRAGYGSLVILNLCALRSRWPDLLLRHPDPVGPDNDQWIKECAHHAPQIVVAWGNNAPPARAHAVLKNLSQHKLVCLGRTKHGHPRHPLMVPYVQQFEAFT